MSGTLEKKHSSVHANVTLSYKAFNFARLLPKMFLVFIFLHHRHVTVSRVWDNEKRLPAIGSFFHKTGNKVFGVSTPWRAQGTYCLNVISALELILEPIKLYVNLALQQTVILTFTQLSVFFSLGTV